MQDGHVGNSLPMTTEAENNGQGRSDCPNKNNELEKDPNAENPDHRGMSKLLVARMESCGEDVARVGTAVNGCEVDITGRVLLDETKAAPSKERSSIEEEGGALLCGEDTPAGQTHPRETGSMNLLERAKKISWEDREKKIDELRKESDIRGAERLGSLEIDSSISFTASRRKETHRRVAVKRLVCEYGMDQVGTHVASIRSWIKSMHSRGDRQRGWKKGLSYHQKHKSSESAELDVRDSAFPYGVSVQIELEDALRGLSACIYAAKEKESEEEISAGEVKRIVEIVARIPSFMKTIILIEDEEERKQVLSFPIVRRVMLCKYSVLSQMASCELAQLLAVDTINDMRNADFDSTSWLLELLKSGSRSLKEKAIEYLELISNLTAQDYSCVAAKPEQTLVGIDGPAPTEEDEEEFQVERRALFVAVGKLRLLVPLLFSLQNKDIERAAVTPVIRSVLDDAISLPFSVVVVFSDLLFNILLVFGFRNIIFQVLQWFQGRSDEEYANSFWTQFLNSVGLLALFYFVFRFVGEVVAMIRISWRCFLVNFMGLWTVVELGALVTLFINVIILFGDANRLPWAGNTYFILSAFSIGLVWAKLIGFLQVLNRKLATFILAIVQITMDIRLFILIILLTILAFGDMLYVILSSDYDTCPQSFDSSGAIISNDDDENENPYCESRWLSYLGVYRVIIGDMEYSDYSSSPLTIVLFVLLTFVGIIILLNILIAIVDESYEKSKMKAAALFGRARLALVAKIIALEGMLLPYDPKIHVHKHRWKRVYDRSAHYFMWIMSLALFGCAWWIFYEISVDIIDALIKRGISDSGSTAVAVVSLLPLYIITAVLLSFAFTGWGSHRRSWRHWVSWFQDNKFLKYLCQVPVTFITLSILGTRRKKRKKKDDEDEWAGRLDHIDGVVRSAVAESDERTKQVVALMQLRMEQIEADRRTEVDKLQKEIERKEKKHDADLKAMEARIVGSLLTAIRESSDNQSKEPS